MRGSVFSVMIFFVMFICRAKNKEARKETKTNLAFSYMDGSVVLWDLKSKKLKFEFHVSKLMDCLS